MGSSWAKYVGSSLLTVKAPRAREIAKREQRIAWLEDELDRRKLEVPEPESSPEPILPAMRHLVVLRRFRDVPEALLAKGRLEASGIECFLADENMVRMDWFISNLLGGVKLLVQAADFSKASEILNDPAGSDSSDDFESDQG